MKRDNRIYYIFHLSIVIGIGSFLLACSSRGKESHQTFVAALPYNCIHNVGADKWADIWENPLNKAILLKNPKIHYRIKECLRDTSIIVLTTTFVESDHFLRIKNLGDINGDGINDSIMVIPELYIRADSSIEEGASVIFTDPKIPRIRVDICCLDVDYIFPVADINEDGFLELGKYYSSCVSRFKRIDLISMKDGQWEVQGSVTYDIYFEFPSKEYRVQKVSRNVFRMREIMIGRCDINSRIDKWVTFTMN